MRLKHIGSVPLVSGQLTINDKNLNYEIETLDGRNQIDESDRYQ